MIVLRRPSGQVIRDFLAHQSRASPRYPGVGRSKKGEAPRRFRQVTHRVQVGVGEHAYGMAIKALYELRMYRHSGVELFPPKLTLLKNETLAVLARHFGCWSLNASRVIYKLDEKAPIRRCGFGIGTLPEHVLEGEERYTVVWQEDDSVWYDFFAFVRARQLAAQIGVPLTRWKYRQLVAASADAMVEAVKDVELPAQAGAEPARQI